MSSEYIKGKLYLDVPFAEKDAAKALGAKYDGDIKKWYYEGNIYDYPLFAKWILKDDDEAIIAYDYIYVLKTKRQCWKCHKDTTVIALGIGEYIYMYRDEDDNIQLVFEENEAEYNPLHIAWTEDEKDIPQKLLNYLKTHYPVKTGFSKTLRGECFANHCEGCGALQGNWFLFNEPDSPFSPLPFDQNEYIHKMEQITVKMIPIDSNLLLNWNVGFGDQDEDYLTYCPKIYLDLRKGNDVSLISDDDYITYKEMYEL